MKIIIDADACPRSVLAICLEVGEQKQIPVWTVASFNHQLNSAQHIIVGNAPQETDLKVVNIAEKGDVAVTQDWGLASMLLGKGVYCLNPHGSEYQEASITFLLERREALAKLRRSGGRTKGPAKRTSAADKHFKKTLLQIIAKAKA